MITYRLIGIFTGVCCILLTCGIGWRNASPRRDCADSTLVSAVSVCFDLSGNAFIIDVGVNTIWKLSRQGSCLGKLGGFGWSSESFDRPSDIACSNNLDLYVADYGNHRIQRYDRNFNYVSTIPPESSPENSARPFGFPRSIAISRLGALFIVDGDNARIVKYSNENSVDQTFGNTGIGDARLRAPTRVRIAANDAVVVQDGAVLKIYDAFGNYVQTVGRDIFRSPVSFTVEDDDVYIADSSCVYVARRMSRLDTLICYAATPFLGNRSALSDIAVFGDTLYSLASGKLGVLTVLNRRPDR